MKINVVVCNEEDWAYVWVDNGKRKQMAVF